MNSRQSDGSLPLLPLSATVRQQLVKTEYHSRTEGDIPRGRGTPTEINPTERKGERGIRRKISGHLKEAEHTEGWREDREDGSSFQGNADQEERELIAKVHGKGMSRR